ELDRLGATFFTSNCHKWLCTPKGSAMLHVREDWIDRIYPATISHGYNWKCPQFNALQNEFDWPGTDDFTPWLCVGDTIDYFEKILGDFGTKLNRMRQYNHNLIIAARRLLCERFKSEPVCPESMLTSLASVSLPQEKTRPRLLQLHAAAGLHPVHIRLLTDYGIEVPVFNWRQWPDLTVRVSAQLYNDITQYERLADALCEICNG
ncbi:MAG: aminotransferase, partial [Planctomycetia bacterium]|nr:aminotransferase [Planctomycetia bacterium]